MSVIIKSGDSTDLAHVTTNSALKVALDGTDPGESGYVKLLDATGSPVLTTENGALDVSVDALVLYEQVDGNNLNTNLWLTSVSGMTVTQTNGFITLNAATSVVAGNYAILTSIKSIPLYCHLPVKITINLVSDILPQAGCVMEVGMGSVAGVAAPTDGVFFRWNASGEFRGVVNYAGSETVTPVLTPINTFDVTLLEIVTVESGAQFFIDDVMVGEIDIPPAQAFPTNSGRLPLFARVYNTTGPAVPPVLYIGQVVVVQQAMTQNKSWDNVLAGMGRTAYQSPVTAFAQTANHTNSTSPTSATLSNTAAGYATLGGRFQFVAVAGAVTDFALFAFQVPAGYQMFVNTITIATVSTGSALGAATLLDWSVGVNASAVSLATADGAGTWAPRRVPLGIQTFGALAAIGAAAPDIVRTFYTPLVVDAGRYLHVIMQCPVGAATVSQIFRGDVMINGYFE